MTSDLYASGKTRTFGAPKVCFANAHPFPTVDMGWVCLYVLELYPYSQTKAPIRAAPIRYDKEQKIYPLLFRFVAGEPDTFGIAYGLLRKHYHFPP